MPEQDSAGLGPSRLTFRARMTAIYTAMLAVCGAVIMVAVYTFMRYVPTYNISEMEQSSSVPVVIPTDAAAYGEVDRSLLGTRQSVVQIDVRDVSDLLSTLLVALVVAIIVVVAVGAVVAWVLAGRILRPLHLINHAAQLAAQGSLGHRVALTGPHDEIRQLSETFDEMLARIERSFAAHDRFTANASHELRTPLSTTKTILEVALADPGVDRAALLSSARRVQQVNLRNIDLIESLLDLTVIDQAQIKHEPVPLGPLIHQAAEDVEQERAAASITLTIPEHLPDCAVLGDGVLLHRLVFNLLQNAVRHNIDKGTISISLLDDGEKLRLAVANDGMPIDQDRVLSLTEPFVRAHNRVASSEGHRGFGLGLALVANIVALHRGTLTLSARPGGGLSVLVELNRIGFD